MPCLTEKQCAFVDLARPSCLFWGCGTPHRQCAWGLRVVCSPPPFSFLATAACALALTICSNFIMSRASSVRVPRAPSAALVAASKLAQSCSWHMLRMTRQGIRMQGMGACGIWLPSTSRIMDVCKGYSLSGRKYTKWNTFFCRMENHKENLIFSDKISVGEKHGMNLQLILVYH